MADISTHARIFNRMDQTAAQVSTHFATNKKARLVEVISRVSILTKGLLLGGQAPAGFAGAFLLVNTGIVGDFAHHPKSILEL